MTDPLDGVDHKIGRAKAHLADLQERIGAVVDPDKQRFTLEYDSQTGKHRLDVFGVPAVPIEWSLIFGEALFNLRASLDHLAWQLVLLDGGKPNRYTQFPIRQTPFDDSGIRIPTQLKPAIKRTDILKALEESQPYVAYDVVPYNGAVADYRLSLLWQMARLNIIDKHRVLLVMLCAPNVDNMWWGLREGERNPDFIVNWSALKDGSPIGWLDFHGAEPPADFDPHPAIQVVVNEADTPRLAANSVTNVLGVFIHNVEDLIINLRFRPLFS